jgi:hypothetical protein
MKSHGPEHDTGSFERKTVGRMVTIASSDHASACSLSQCCRCRGLGVVYRMSRPARDWLSSLPRLRPRVGLRLSGCLIRELPAGRILARIAAETLKSTFRRCHDGKWRIAGLWLSDERGGMASDDTGTAAPYRRTR